MHGMITDKPIFLIEYNLSSERKIPKDTTIDEAKKIIQKNKLTRKIRNDLVYLLKYRLYATPHLQSCWRIDGKRLELAKVEIEGLRRRMKAKGFDDADERIYIVKIITDSDGIDYYDGRKVAFLLKFIEETLAYFYKAEEEGVLGKSTLWRCEKAYKTISIIKEEVKEHKRYNEIEIGLAKLGKYIKEAETLFEDDEDE